MSKKSFICIGCPMGCELEVEQNGEDITVANAACKIGERYGREEVLNPTRTITASIPVSGSHIRMLSVKTRTPVPKNSIFECMASLKGVVATAPVHIGDVVVENVYGTGVDFIATREVCE